MLDIRFVREHLDEVATAMKNRNHSWDSEYFQELDESRRSVISQEEELLNQRNVLSKSIGKLMGEGKKEEAEAAVHDLASRLNKAGKALQKEGVELLYHNHNCELRRVNGEKRAYDILLEETDPRFVNFEFDSYWFAEGGTSPLAWMQRLGSRMKLWHINDRGSRVKGSAVTPILKTDSMELGTGNMDLDSLMDQALTVGVDAVILESHRNWIDGSPIKSAQLSAQYLRRVPDHTEESHI